MQYLGKNTCIECGRCIEFLFLMVKRKKDAVYPMLLNVHIQLPLRKSEALRGTNHKCLYFMRTAES